MVNGCGPLVSWIMFTSLVKAVPTPTNAKRQQDSKGESGVRCYTCVNVSDNMMCNQYAIDRPCPEGQDFCHTLHIMDSLGASVIVNKKCANTTECWPRGVGCVLVDTQTICVSCCDEMYCNVTVPTNQSNAIYSNNRTKHKKKFTKNRKNEINANFTIKRQTISLSCILIVFLRSIILCNV